jgi:hypothetical protein
MGLNHEKLTLRYAGRDFRLTDVSGESLRRLLLRLKRLWQAAPRPAAIALYRAAANAYDRNRDGRATPN